MAQRGVAAGKGLGIELRLWCGVLDVGLQPGIDLSYVLGVGHLRLILGPSPRSPLLLLRVDIDAEADPGVGARGGDLLHGRAYGVHRGGTLGGLDDEHLTLTLAQAK